MTREDTKGNEGAKLFELGFLYTPLVPAEDLGSRIEATLKAAITANQGVIVDEGEARMLSLSYPVSKSAEHKKTTFNEAYFGAIRFHLTPDKVALLEEKLKAEPEIIRYSLLIMPKGIGKMIVPKKIVSRKRPVKIEAPAEETPKTAPPMSEEAIDKEIEGLLTKTS